MDSTFRSLDAAVADIRGRMARAARAAGRQPEDILLCAACKTRTCETVRESAALPIDLFGENHMQELLLHGDAGAYLGKPVHFIGHLQTNKVRKVVGRAAMIQSVDNLRLLEAIEQEALRQGLTQEILLEINLAGEPGKSGISPEALPALLEAACACGHVRVRGLMAIPPAGETGDAVRRRFAHLRRLLEQSRARLPALPLDTLSMGMSGSFEEAILEGATIVRIGTAIYGPRPSHR